MQAASIALAVIGGCALAAAVAIELATGDPAAGANYGDAEPDNMHEAELGIKGAFQPQIFGDLISYQNDRKGCAVIRDGSSEP